MVEMRDLISISIHNADLIEKLKSSQYGDAADKYALGEKNA